MRARIPPKCAARRRVVQLAPVALAACAGTPRRPASGGTPPPAGGLSPSDEARVEQLLARSDVSLLGEVHDNALQHQLRAAWLTRLAAGRRFVLAMEQFDLPAQPAIDAALAGRSSPRELAERAGFRFDGWHWAFYEPYVALACDRGLPLVAANLPSSRLRAAAPRRALPPLALGARTALERAIDDGHCGVLPPAAVAAMADAQRARDAAMAEVIGDARARTGLPVVLLAGNGHVRGDFGVPVYLRPMRPDDRVAAIGLEEQGAENRAAGSCPAASSSSSTKLYDLCIATPAQARADPCAAFIARQRAATSRPAPDGRPNTSTQ